MFYAVMPIFAKFYTEKQETKPGFNLMTHYLNHLIHKYNIKDLKNRSRNWTANCKIQFLCFSNLLFFFSLSTHLLMYLFLYYLIKKKIK